MTRDEKIERALLDIHSQATRKERASDLKRYLVTDLEIIARKSQEALDAKDDPQSRSKPQPPFYGMLQLVEE